MPETRNKGRVNTLEKCGVTVRKEEEKILEKELQKIRHEMENKIKEIQKDTKIKIERLKGVWEARWEKREKEWKEKMEAWEKEKEELAKRLENEMEERKEEREKKTREEEEAEKKERRKRKENIVIKGKAFKDKEVEKKVQEYIKDSLNVMIRVEEAFVIKKKGEEEGRIVVAKLRCGDKAEVMRRKRGMEKGVFIENDMTKYERELQRDVVILANEAREKGKKVKIGYKKFMEDGEWFRWSEKMKMFMKKE